MRYLKILFTYTIIFFVSLIRETMLIIIYPFFYLYLGIRLLIIAQKAGKRILPNLVWGTDPIISNKYWSEAMRSIGYKSDTIMSTYYIINNKSDFDIYYDEYFKKYSKIPILKRLIERNKLYLIFLETLNNYDIFHIPAHGFILKSTRLKYYEAQLLHFARKKIIILPYGGDLYRYSQVYDISLRHALMKSYPAAARNENELTKQFNYWVKNADFFLPFFQIDGVGRWDSFPYSSVVINTEQWVPRTNYNRNNGKDGIVRIIHTPNHRGFKGSEFIINAVEKIKNEGYNIELILMERKTNDEVKAIMFSADILVEQLVATAYALSGIEGMSLGLPVISNLESNYYTQAFRRYSYLNECPIYSATPESIYDKLKTLIQQPSLREELGKRGRAYVEKYHSYKTAQIFFPKIYDKIWNNNDHNLIDFYDPNNINSYNNTYDRIK
jgi:glycosyltransferase involved in cell wall biosynthesis